jgi:ferredoxin-fold anticodon binding domain-containing protein
MKVVTLHKRVTTDELLSHLQQKLNAVFQEQRQTDIVLQIFKVDDAVDISIPELYEGALFQIVVNGSELWITRNEHYVDDVNSLAIESILHQLFDDLSGGEGTDLVQEG